MDLRSGVPFWLRKNGWLRIYPPQSCDIVGDVAIVGGGISGALIAERLAREGHAVVVIDRRNIGEGSTAASTALLQYELDVEMLDLAKRYGENVAVRAYRAGIEALDDLAELAPQLPIDCHFERRPSLYLASRTRDVVRLRKEFEFRQEHGFDVEWWNADTIESRLPFAAPGAIFSRGDAEVDSFRLTHGLLARAEKLGAQVFDRTELESYRFSDDWVAITTNRGEIQARTIIFATGYEAAQFLPQSFGRLRSTYALATEPTSAAAALPEGCLVWETARPYLYFRTTPEGRLIAGGEDTSFATDHRRDRLLQRKIRKLEQRLRTRFPNREIETACSWAGTFGESPDGLPVIGPHPELPLAYFALGYGGNGITFSALAARLIADHIAGRPNADAEIFGFARLQK